MQTSGRMPDAANVTKTKTAALHDDFPQLPGEQVLAHQGTAWWEAAEARLAAKRLLVVAQGGTPPEVDSILDVDLSSVPELPPEHRDYHRRMETRTKIQTQNEANRIRRWHLTMQAWTELYTLVKTATEVTAPTLSREMKELCDLYRSDGIAGGYFDGPRAWRMIEDRLFGRRPIMKGRRLSTCI